MLYPIRERRSGLSEITQCDVNINMTLTAAEKIAEIREMAEQLGLDAAKLLGNVSDAEFEDVTG